MASVMRRLDHAMIFVLIVGTYTPFCLLALSNAWGIGLLSVTAGIATAGALTRLAWLDTPRRLAVLLYLAAGWVALVAASQIPQQLDTAPLGLLLLGGIAYSVGAIAYAAKRPDPWPSVFGYHEVFHSFTIAEGMRRDFEIGRFGAPKGHHFEIAHYLGWGARVASRVVGGNPPSARVAGSSPAPPLISLHSRGSFPALSREFVV